MMVTDRHKNFARAVVALAREHKMDQIMMTFRTGFNVSLNSGECYEQVSMNWHTGRHGVEGNIEMSTVAKQNVPEKS